MLTFKKLTAGLLLLNLVTPTHADIKKDRIEVNSPVLPLLQNAKLVKSLEPSKMIQFVVWLKLRNKAQLDQLVNEIYDPNSPNYQKFLTHDEITQQYAPNQEAENAVLQYFLNQNLQAKIVDHRVIVTGEAHQIEKIFQIKLNYYKFKNRTIYANSTAPTLSADVASHVLGISGLSDMVNFKPDVRFLTDQMKPKQSVQPTANSIGGFSGKNLRTAYQVATIPPINGQAINGAGQTIVITDACGLYSPSQILADANVYNATNGLPTLSAANFAIVKPDGTAFASCGATSSTGWEAEIALDVEAVHTMAPGANIVLVLSSNSFVLGNAIATTVNHLINNNYTIAGFHNATVVSNSWGEQEGFGFWPIESTLELAAAHGISFNFSTGDCGDGSYVSASCSPILPQKNVQYPASSAYVTAIGGTSLFVDSTWKYAFETVWGTFYNNAFNFGGGGGISRYFGPVAWQNAINFFIAGGYGPIYQFNKRALPDISMVADPLTGLNIFVGGGWRTVGGTSLSNALFSGMLTLINQTRVLANKGPLGLAAPYFYTHNSPLSHAEAFNNIQAPHQIISGATAPPAGAPNTAFSIFNITFGWNSSLSITPSTQFWNDAVGVDTPNVPNFVKKMATF